MEKLIDMQALSPKSRRSFFLIFNKSFPGFHHKTEKRERKKFKQKPKFSVNISLFFCYFYLL